MIFEDIGGKYGIKVYINAKHDNDKLDQYLVYRLGSNKLDLFQHEFETRIKTYDLMYFIRQNHYSNKKYYEMVWNNCDKFIRDLKKKGYICNTGFYEVGDIDSIGFLTLLSSFNYSEVFI